MNLTLQVMGSIMETRSAPSQESPLVEFGLPRPESAFPKNGGRRCHTLTRVQDACHQGVGLGTSPNSLWLEAWQVAGVGLGDTGRGALGEKPHTSGLKAPVQLHGDNHKPLVLGGRRQGRDPAATWRRRGQPQSSILSLCQLQKQFLLLLAPLAGTLGEQINVGSGWHSEYR